MARKGLSPLVATVLIVAFTISTAMIIMSWYRSFSLETSERIANQTSQKIDCSYGAISFRNICTNEDNLTGIIENTGNIELRNIEINIVYKNGTTLVYNSTHLGLEDPLLVGNRKYFNIYVGNKNEIAIIVLRTNCPKVDDEIIGSSLTNC
ncbi:MAG: archaellin/type IV pilin N-terminal domain-containing protein [Candidatus Aenigmatarchaeota archaeon]